jgi:hypothetical protein
VIITAEQRERYLSAAVYAFMVFGGGLSDLPFTLAEAIMRQWRVDLDTIKSLNLCRYPSHVEGVVIASEVALRYGDLSDVPGFFCEFGCWFMDLDSRYQETGFLMPVGNGLIHTLMVFRSPRDMRPFPLGTIRRKAAA